jgi:hypothetical protein
MQSNDEAMHGGNKLRQQDEVTRQQLEVTQDEEARTKEKEKVEGKRKEKRE